MARMIKREVVKESQPHTDAVVGRDLLETHRAENEAMADSLVEGETIQYYDDGWRVGKVEKLPVADEPRYGEVRIVHASTGRVWVAARDTRRIS